MFSFILIGKALEMSFDHKPTDPPELERIAKAGGQVGIDGRVNGGLNLTRAIGVLNMYLCIPIPRTNLQ
jgi:serine/threonine protein phosphatase PrpC